MGCLVCQICDKQLSRTGHVCKEEDVKAYIDELKLAANKAERQLDRIQERVRFIFTQLPDLGSAEINVKTSLLKDLWEATENAWYRAKVPDVFFGRWLVMHTLLSAAYNIFKPKSRDDARGKINRLKIAVEESRPVMGYMDSDTSLTTEDILCQMNTGKN